MEDEDEKNAQIEDYLSKNQGADDDSKDIGDNETASPEIATAVPQIAAAAPVAPTAAALPPTTDDASKIAALKAYLTPMYSPTKDDAAIAAARDQSNNQNFIANIGQALGNIATANSRAHGGQGIDDSLYQGIKQQGQQGVANAIAAKQNNVADFLRNHELERQMAQDKLKEGGAKILADKADPKSAASQRFIKSVQLTHPNDSAKFEGLSENEAVGLLKDLESKSKIDANAASRAASLAQAGAINDARAQSKSDKDQKKAYQDLTLKDEGGRGTPQNVVKSMNAQVRLKNAQDILNGAPKGADGNPDYNKITPQIIHLLDTEVESIASQGNPTEGGRKGLEPSTLEQSWANFKNKFVGPNDTVIAGANAGPFIQNIAQYLSSLKNTADENVNSFRKENYSAYEDNLTDDQQAKYKKKHPELFQDTQSASNSTPAAAPQNAQASIKMQSTDGTQYLVPPSGIEGAKSRGWKPVNQTAQVSQ